MQFRVVDTFLTSSCLLGNASASIEPTNSGFRLSLVYALIYTAPTELKPTGFDSSLHQANIEAALRDRRRWLTSTCNLEKFAVFLHSSRYTSSVHEVAGADKIKVAVLRRAAKTCGFKMYIGKISGTEEGVTEECNCAEETADRNTSRARRREEAACEWDDDGCTIPPPSARIKLANVVKTSVILLT